MQWWKRVLWMKLHPPLLPLANFLAIVAGALLVGFLLFLGSLTGT